MAANFTGRNIWLFFNRFNYFFMTLISKMTYTFVDFLLFITCNWKANSYISVSPIIYNDFYLSEIQLLKSLKMQAWQHIISNAKFVNAKFVNAKSPTRTNVLQRGLKKDKIILYLELFSVFYLIFFAILKDNKPLRLHSSLDQLYFGFSWVISWPGNSC